MTGFLNHVAYGRPVTTYSTFHVVQYNLFHLMLKGLSLIPNCRMRCISNLNNAVSGPLCPKLRRMPAI
jgi:hypothetical protein